MVALKSPILGEVSDDQLELKLKQAIDENLTDIPIKTELTDDELINLNPGSLIHDFDARSELSRGLKLENNSLISNQQNKTEILDTDDEFYEVKPSPNYETPNRAATMFTCYKCHSKNDLIDHDNEIHKNRRIYLCAQCSFSSAQKKEVTFHMNTVHCDERPHAYDERSLFKHQARYDIVKKKTVENN